MSVSSGLPLRGVVVEGAHDHLRAGRLGYGNGGIRAARITTTASVQSRRPAMRADVVCFVLGEDDGNQVRTVFDHQNALTVL
ncbi:MAG: hypothetical protein R2854_13615 [Caldilineaceae bacterium]